MPLLGAEVTRLNPSGMPGINYGSFSSKVAAPPAQVNKDGAKTRKKRAPKKYKDPILEQLIKDLLELRNRHAVFDADEVTYEEQLDIVLLEQERAEKIKVEILARIELIKAKTKAEIAYKEYIYKLIQDIQEKRNQLLEDELISILLLAA